MCGCCLRDAIRLAYQSIVSSWTEPRGRQRNPLQLTQPSQGRARVTAPYHSSSTAGFAPAARQPSKRGAVHSTQAQQSPEACSSTRGDALPDAARNFRLHCRNHIACVGKRLLHTSNNLAEMTSCVRHQRSFQTVTSSVSGSPPPPCNARLDRHDVARIRDVESHIWLTI
jgi:hypothetical protein